MAEEKPKKKRGPKGGIKHQPGRGHDRKSKASKTRHFSRRAKEQTERLEQEAREAWAEWDGLPEETRKLLGTDGQPMMPRPKRKPNDANP